MAGRVCINSGVPDGERGANRSPGKINVKTGPPLSLYFGFITKKYRVMSNTTGQTSTANQSSVL